jgi:MFS family permease
VGPLSDAFPKNRLMAYMNALKMMGVLLLLLGVQPMFAFALIGLAASVYAPSKYGLATESVEPRLLVRANGWLEASVVLSAVFGIALGGALTGLTESGVGTEFANLFLFASGVLVETQTLPAMALVLCVYVTAAALNFGLRPMQRRVAMVPLTWHSVRWSAFWTTNLKLWRDPLGGVSLYVTTLYWGVGAVMQFAVLLWAEQTLELTLKSGAYLQALVALGVILGAFLAGRSFKLHSARQALPWGLLLAVLLPVMVWVTEVWVAIPLLLCAGLSGGMLLVPMNSLLQHRGMQVLSSGRSIAVQGFNENLSVLVMLGIYSGLLAFGVSLSWIMLMFATVLIAGIAPLCLLLWRQVR